LSECDGSLKQLFECANWSQRFFSPGRTGTVCTAQNDICDCLRAIAFPYENARKKPFAGLEFIPILRAPPHQSVSRGSRPERIFCRPNIILRGGFLDRKCQPLINLCRTDGVSFR